MTIAADDSLTLGLRALATLACRGPLDVPLLARLHDSAVPEVEAVVTELERDGLVQRLDGLCVVTRRGAELTRPAPALLH